MTQRIATGRPVHPAAPNRDVAARRSRRARHRHARRLSACVGGLLIIAASTAGQDPTTDAAPAASVPPEELRLGNKDFREGLKQRGLSELLELHLADFPPTTESESLLLMRDMRLARFADPSRPAAERRRALAEANELLQQLIAARPDDSRRFDWRVELAESLMFQEAEQPAAAVLFQQAGDPDRAALRQLAETAMDVLGALRSDIRREYDRIDALTLEQLERGGTETRLDALDAISARVAYVELWARFFRAETRDSADPVRDAELAAITQALADHPEWLTTPHEVSGVQVPLLLLAGMVHRRHAHHERASEYLEQVAAVTDRLSDPSEKSRMASHRELAALERARAEADAGAFNEALRRLSELRTDLGDNDEAFFYRLSAARTEREILRRRADEARRQGRVDAADIYARQAWQAMQQLINADPTRRDRVLAAVYEALPRDADPTRLDPFERCAVVAGLLVDAEETADRTERDRLLSRAVDVADSTLPLLSEQDAVLRPTLIFHHAIAEYRLGQIRAAASRFLKLGREYPQHDEAENTLTLAVQLAGRALDEAPEADRTTLDSLYGEALAALVTAFPTTDAGRYWRFHYAQWLDRHGRHEQAAAAYGAVATDHEHALEAAFLRARTLAKLVESAAADQEPDDVLQNRLLAFHDAYRGFRLAATKHAAHADESGTLPATDPFVARGELLRAEVYLLPRVGRAQEALTALKAAAETAPDHAELATRRWQLQLRAYVALHRFDDAASTLSQAAGADPRQIAETLQPLYDLLIGAFFDRIIGDRYPTPREADFAVHLAEYIDNGISTATDASEAQRRAAAAQRAESLLLAGRLASAKQVYDALLPVSQTMAPVQLAQLNAIQLRIRVGLAETSFKLADFEAALRLYHPLAVQLSSDEALRWHALLRDLACRAALGRRPRDIVKVIDQQRQLFPALGGTVSEARLTELRREMEARLSSENTEKSPAPTSKDGPS